MRRGFGGAQSATLSPALHPKRNTPFYPHFPSSQSPPYGEHPTVFILLFEKGKMILPVGKWVFEQVVRTCKRILSFEHRFTMSFNVSYLQIMDDDFIRFVEQTLKKYRMDGSHFIAELTETHFDENPEKLKEFVDGCKKLGIQIALDDFGNGYSSLGLLLKYPATVVKLDKSLLTELTG